MELNSQEPENTIETTLEKPKAVYSALFVKDIQGLLASFPPKHSKVFASHSTIGFLPTSLDNIEIGRVGTLKIIGRATDEKGDALFVENPKSKNKF